MKKLLILLLLLTLTLTSSNLVINVSAEENQKTIIDNNVDLTNIIGKYVSVKNNRLLLNNETILKHELSLIAKNNKNINVDNLIKILKIRFQELNTKASFNQVIIDKDGKITNNLPKNSNNLLYGYGYRSDIYW